MAIEEASESSFGLRPHVHQRVLPRRVLHPHTIPCSAPLPRHPFRSQILPMTPAASKSWLTGLAVTGFVAAATLLAPPAQAQNCVSGLLINDIINEPSGSYTCQLGQQVYTFFSTNLVELNNSSNTSAINFFDSNNLQEITFVNTAATSSVGFWYNVVSEFESIDELVLSFTQSPAFPPPLDAFVAGSPITPTPASPWAASPNSLTLLSFFDPDTSQGPQTLTSLKYQIYKSPAPLPLAGAGFAFGFSRKLRRRVLQASSRKNST